MANHGFSQELRGYDFYYGGVQGSVSFSGSGSLSASGSPVRKAAVGFLGTGDLSLGIPNTFNGGQVSFVGVGDLRVAAVGNVIGDPVLFSGSANLLILPPRRFSPSIVEDMSAIRSLFVLDGRPLTEHNRDAEFDVVQNHIETQTWRSARNRYYNRAGGRRRFSISWTMLPGDRYTTVDQMYGRDFIKSVSEDPDIHVLQVLNLDSNGATPHSKEVYNVVVISYSENLVRRFLGDDIYLWDCDIELEEV